MSDTERNQELTHLLMKAYQALSDAPHTSAVDKESSTYEAWYRTTRRQALESCDPERWRKHDERRKKKE